LQAILLGHVGEADSTFRASQECRKLADQLADRRVLSHAIQHMGAAYLLAGEPRAAAQYLDEALNLARAVDDPLAVVGSLIRLGQCWLLLGEPGHAQHLFEEAVRTCSESGESWFRASSLWNLAIASSRMGNTSAAMEAIRESLRLSQAVGNTIGISQALEVLAATLSHTTTERAAELLGAAESLRIRHGGSLVPILAPLHEETQQQLRRSLGQRKYQNSTERGRNYTPIEAVAIALVERQQSTHPPESIEPTLTRRECQVAELVAQGKTNKEIAATLVISRRTVEGHVENAMNKLGFDSRSQIAAWVAGRDRGPS
jgi:non-specific serine/threonine protein kinase